MVLNTIGLVLVLGLWLVLASYITPPGRGLGRGLPLPRENNTYYVPLGARPEIHGPQYNRVSVRGSFRVRVRVSVSVSIVYYAAGEGSCPSPEKIIYYAAIFSYDDHESPVVPWLGFRVSIRVWLSFRFSVNIFQKFTLSLP